MSKGSRKDIRSIASEWDALSGERDKLIHDGLDVSLLTVNAPCILQQVSDHCNSESILDVGCGTGYLSAMLSRDAKFVTGIDISEKSVNIASERYQKISNIKFVCSSIADYYDKGPFTTCTANMVFMTDPDFEDDLEVIYGLLPVNGNFLMSITHPCFWPTYWGYQAEDWFQYAQECYVEKDFSTSLSGAIGTSTHIHRPLSYYINVLIRSGFVISEVIEPYPISTTPPGYHYDIPRFLHIRAVKK